MIDLDIFISVLHMKMKVKTLLFQRKQELIHFTSKLLDLAFLF